MKRSTGLTDQDIAFAIAQWCSGITQREIARHFGLKGGNSSAICNGIERFIRKYYPEVPLVPSDRWWTGAGAGRVDNLAADRKVLAKIAFCHFMAQREEAA